MTTRKPKNPSALPSAKSGLSGTPAGPPADPRGPIDPDRVDQQIKRSAQRKVDTLIDSHPDEAVKLLRSWMREDT